MYRDSNFCLPGECEGGNGWTKVDGLMSWVSSGENIVWGVTTNGDLWYRYVTPNGDDNDDDDDDDSDDDDDECSIS